ncbi:hypothetical protein JMJ35_009670 [Cladonia borealis]|uniref:SRP9 domain-containing protein n=1 Tax=Cladonia borealis TaxID=184061 RepID=A0AA39QSR7_9LECA|nr:hypothetical protein JMJ35_009670 [Cladonia borealis]
MPYLPTAQAYLEQSRLLISARPTTTKIITKYTLPKKGRKPKETSSSPPPTSETSHPQQQQSQPPKATLTLKTYDPASGVCLKYSTDKAAEVGRLIAALGTCGRIMAALPAKEERADEGAMVEGDAPVVKEEAKAVQKESGKEMKGGQGGHKGGDKGGVGGGGGGKKKKGKK